ncbi:MAG: acetolactate synthase large subunit [Acidimicrobiales bacterium]
MNGAGALIRTLVEHGVDTCFTNPGTSEMHFVAALDEVPAMRSVLALFEGVASGAADGYARMTGRPAATLLHLGPGLGNALANLHNARRARSPMMNIVGDHALSHREYDAQLQSDIETVARNVSPFVRTATSTATLCSDALDALAAAHGPPGAVATLILPADVSWSEGGTVTQPNVAGAPGLSTTRRGASPSDHVVESAAAALRSGQPTTILIGGRGGAGTARGRLSDLAAATGARLLAETFPARLERGSGRPPVERLAYLAEFAMMQLEGTRHLLLVDAASPVSFFAYPDRPGNLVPSGCQVHQLAGPSDDVAAAVDALASYVGTQSGRGVRQAPLIPERPSGALTAQTVCQAIGSLLPEGAIVSDEGNTSSLFAPDATAGAPPHDWLCLAGGAIGQGLPLATGAAIACPDRRVLALEADGSAMYTLQAWWTMAREGLDVTTVLLNNRSYAVLNLELDRVGAEPPGPRAREMLDLGRPDLDFVSLARGMGLQAARAETAEEFTDALARALATPGPSVVEALIPSLF